MIQSCDHDNFIVCWDGFKKCPVCEKDNDQEKALGALKDEVEQLKSEFE